MSEALSSNPNIPWSLVEAQTLRGDVERALDVLLSDDILPIATAPGIGGEIRVLAGPLKNPDQSLSTTQRISIIHIPYRSRLVDGTQRREIRVRVRNESNPTEGCHVHYFPEDEHNRELLRPIDSAEDDLVWHGITHAHFTQEDANQALTEFLNNHQ
jgi:hypothetical protein